MHDRCTHPSHRWIAVAPAHSSGTVDVTVATAAGTSATSSADRYTYDAPPTVTGRSPNGGPTELATGSVAEGAAGRYEES